MPRRQPRRPSIGLNSCSSCTRCLIFSTGMPSFFARSFCWSLVVRQELVQRRIEEADGRREAFQRLEDADEVLALIRQQLGERLFARLERLGEDHLAHRVDAIAFEEHVLGAASGRCRRRRTRGVARSAPGVSALVRTVIRVAFGAPLHQLREVLERAALLGLGVVLDQALDRLRTRAVLIWPGIDLAGRAVDRKLVAFVEDLAVRP